jgi:outer membrane protein assembly complex protein YaeT
VKRCSKILLLVLAWLFSFPESALTVLIDGLDTTRQWKVARIEFSGNEKFPDDSLHAVILTKERPWYRFWEDRPLFDPVTFTTDLERLRRFYEAEGYYSAEIAYDLDVDRERDWLTVVITVREGGAIVIAEIDVAVTQERDQKPPSLPDELPVKRGEVFREVEYQQSEQTLRTSLLNHGYAHVQSQRKAEVNVDEGRARIHYGLQPGPVTFFGATEIKGTDTVEPELIRRELSYIEGETYSLTKLAESREKLLALGLFGTVRVAPAQSQGTPVVVPMEVEVTEKPHREIKLSVGYSTEDQFRTQLEWRHLNWLGGGRRLSLQAKYSAIAVSGAVELVQPHFLSASTRGSMKFSHDQEKEETYVRNVSRFSPRVDHRFSPVWTAFLAYRVEYDKLNKVSDAAREALGDIRRDGVLSGPTLGTVWNTSDDPFNPKTGHVLSLVLDQAGAIWGGQYSFYKITTEAKKYIEIGWSTVLATRLKIGLADAIGAEKNLPLFERFYSGGEKSVRGYGRRRLGPLDSADDPIGGLSLVEGSVELRRPVWKELNGALFIDFGQVSRRAFDPPVDDLRFSAGFGLAYATPVGPVRIDIGFPFKPPRGDNPWQIHFSIGAYF